MTADETRFLYDYNAWANRRVAEACAQLSTEQFGREVVSSFASVRDTLAHIMGAEWLWLERWRGRSHGTIPPGTDYPDLISVRTSWGNVERDMQTFVSALSDADLARKVSYKNTAGTSYENVQLEMLLHVANHSTYHRGQVITLLRQLGAKPVSTDLSRFIADQRSGAGASGMDLATLRLLYDYTAWAGRRLLEACAALTGDQYTRAIETSFGSVRDTMVHILGGEWLWLERWRGNAPSSMLAPADFPDVAALKKRWAEVEKELATFVNGLTKERINSVEEYKTFTAGNFACPLAGIMHHVVNHGTYHRGQVVTLLRQLGATPVSTDLIVYYRARAGEPER